MVYHKTMDTKTIVMCVVALLLGMLLSDMLKNVCGCKVVEGQHYYRTASTPPPTTSANPRVDQGSGHDYTNWAQSHSRCVGGRCESLAADEPDPADGD
jgi:hypothetical protein